ncbi:hypothetical protein D1007_41168 [Hordeum vulgare]|nr:hypothetical protein D1007_41168 [Hordeum vulgare]
MVKERWALIVSQLGCQQGPVEFWTAATAKLLAYLCGRGANHGSKSKKERARIVDEIAVLDVQADARPFSKAEWAHRYALENPSPRYSYGGRGAENDELFLSFLREEIDKALVDMKMDTAPGPNGWPVEFFKKFWPCFENIFYAIVNGFELGTVDLSRMNYSATSLIPKAKSANNIKLFRPITLMNVSFKLCAKAYTTRLAPIAQ